MAYDEELLNHNIAVRFASGDVSIRRRQPMHTKEDLHGTVAPTGGQLESGSLFENGKDHSGNEGS